MKGTLLAVLFVPLSLFTTATACGSEGPTTASEGQRRTVMIPDSYYVRFQVDGESYHAVPVDGDHLLRGASGGYIFEGPAYVREEGDEVWQCHPRGYQIPQGARIMVSSSRAPVTVRTRDAYCR
jgi:hypothetical protein